jgi:hypothetical protein
MAMAFALAGRADLVEEVGDEDESAAVEPSASS